MFISTASRPIPINAWSNSPDLFDHPTPIGKKLKMISKLFQAEWLKSSGEFGINSRFKFDSEGMRKIFDEGMKSYCSVMLDIECTKLKGKTI
jgi:hypothetical protein